MVFGFWLESDRAVAAEGSECFHSCRSENVLMIQRCCCRPEKGPNPEYPLQDMVSYNLDPPRDRHYYYVIVT